MSSPFYRYLILALIVGTALWLRTVNLSLRPMHADEANQAVKTGELIENGQYAFDPRDHHGPTLYYAALPIAWLRGETTLATLSETTVRLVPAIAGTLAVLLLAALVTAARVPSERWNPTSGRVRATPATENPPGAQVPPQAGAIQIGPPQASGHWTALIAAAFLAVSPPAVYYSRYFIQETLLLTFTLGALVCAQRWWRNGHLAWAIAAGICAGLMQATKASAPLFVGAGLIALLMAMNASRPAVSRPGRHLTLATGVAIAVATLFFSSFGKNPDGLRDAFSVYGPAWQRVSDGAGHEKPWWFYLQLFTWQQTGGLVWQQLLFSGLALGGAIFAFVQQRSIYRWIAIYTLIVAAVFSFTPYKTPWHAVHLVPGMAGLAAAVITALPRWWLGGVMTALVLVTQFDQTRLAVFTRPADPRNPYAYVHSSPDVLKFRPLVEAALTRTPGGIVRVIGKEYWPIPWYLRGLPNIGYWSEPLADCDGALVIATAEQIEPVRARLHGHCRETYLGLRPDVLCVVFTPQP